MEFLKPRRALLALVEKYPGLHVRELARQADLSEALASYHLNKLEEAGLVEGTEEAGFRRFFATKGAPPPEEDRELMSWLRRRVPLQIVLFLLEHAAATHAEITQELRLAKSTVSYHLSVLEGAKILRRIDSGDALALRDPRRVARLLLRWNPPRDLLARFADAWDRFYSVRRPSR